MRVGVKTCVDRTFPQKPGVQGQKKFCFSDSPGDLVVKNLPANAGNTGSIPANGGNTGSIPDGEDPTCYRVAKPLSHNY